MKNKLIILIPIIFIFVSCAGGAGGGTTESAPSNSNTEQGTEENGATGTTGGTSAEQPQSTNENPEGTTGGTTGDTGGETTGGTSNENPEETNEVVRTAAPGFHGFVYLGSYVARDNRNQTLVMNSTNIILNGETYTYLQGRQLQLDNGNLLTGYYYLLQKGTQNYLFGASRANDATDITIRISATDLTELPVITQSDGLLNYVSTTYTVFVVPTVSSGSTSGSSTPAPVDHSWTIDVEGFVFSTDPETGRILTVTYENSSWVVASHTKVQEAVNRRYLTVKNAANDKQINFSYLDNNLLLIDVTENGATTRYRISEYYQNGRSRGFESLYNQLN